MDKYLKLRWREEHIHCFLLSLPPPGPRVRYSHGKCMEERKYFRYPEQEEETGAVSVTESTERRIHKTVSLA